MCITRVNVSANGSLKCTIKKLLCLDWTSKAGFDGCGIVNSFFVLGHFIMFGLIFVVAKEFSV